MLPPDLGPYVSFVNLKEAIKHRAPTLIDRINEIIADAVAEKVNLNTPSWPMDQEVLNEIAAETGCVILGIVTDHGMRWSATFTEHREQLEKA
ncbi:hypothetical protein PJWF_00092 [Achromobacter phage JWF]|uniref:hypothetical protein n=1 Tax=Achromobacter phage JWF TaxID=1589748 RepID=UPI000588E2D3|nr:hypothetical protein AXJ13_gp096 [Achromobacter phage JWF]AJD82985.1 hypothetical protein PJWF_00092 [Achromobacter phage JWF]